MRSTIYTSAGQRRVGALAPELIAARELLLALVWKDVRVRYRYAAAGFLWAVLQPVALMLVLSFVFTVVLRDKAALAGAEGGAPYAVLLLCGLLFWQCFSESVSAATQSLLDNQSLIKKVRFTREVIPLAALGYPMVNLAIGLLVFTLVQAALGGRPQPTIAALPLVFAIQAALTAGLALLLSCGNLLYRDVGYMTGVALLFGFYASPVLYPAALVADAATLPEWAKTLYHANPMAGLITAYRDLLIHGALPDWRALAWPATAAAAALGAGCVVFRRCAPTLSDHV